MLIPISSPRWRMPNLARRRTLAIAVTLSVFFVYFTLYSLPKEISRNLQTSSNSQPSTSIWASRQEHFPVESFRQLPSGRPLSLPKIQHEFPPESPDARKDRQERQAAVRASFAHTWTGYRANAWLKDELTPLTGGSHDSFGHWAATLVDSLDSLWILGFRKEFDEAVSAISNIDFATSTADRLSLFEVTIRYLGGMLSAYDLSGNQILLQKALQLGQMLYTAFDTPNRMPVSYWEWKNARDDGPQEPSTNAASADIGSLTLEFTRLSQISGDPKYFDAVQRISDFFQKAQNLTAIPGLWPIFVNGRDEDFSTGNSFCLGAMADSLYEYLPKMHILLGGILSDYGIMYESFVEAAKRYMFFRPMNPENRNLLIPGSAHTMLDGVSLDGSAQHLACFVGGMIGIGAKTFNREKDIEVAEQLTDGCVWAYESTASGIMPEIFNAVSCPASDDCTWSAQKWHDEVLMRYGFPLNTTAEFIIERDHLPPGFTEFVEGKYILRPEAIESVFIMYRITGDTKWQDKAWKMFTAIENATRTNIAHAALQNVALEKPVQVDSMESFWTAETLKYFYLIFSEPDLISLDDYVFNTEAHPFLRPKVKKGWFWR